jgi:hypothetical protein
MVLRVTSLEGSLGAQADPFSDAERPAQADLPETVVDPWWPLATVG